ncbi:DUF3899 domain-containing protein, partial [Staphylococcus aureus]
LVQEGIFDATSYGFRRLKYQMSSSKKKKSISDDPFFNPQAVSYTHLRAHETCADLVCRLLLEKRCLYSVSYTHLRAHETCADLVCRLLLEKKKTKT